MMNSSIRLHIPRYKQDFGPAFCDTSQKTRQTHPLCLDFRHRGYLCPYPDVLNIDQMCEILSVSTKTGYKIIKEGGICCLKVGRAYRIPKAHLFSYLCIGLQTASAEA